MLTFLQICHPLDNEDFFKRLVLRPLKEGDPAGAELLRVCLLHQSSSCSDPLPGLDEPCLHSENEGGKSLNDTLQSFQS